MKACHSSWSSRFFSSARSCAECHRPAIWMSPPPRRTKEVRLARPLGGGQAKQGGEVVLGGGGIVDDEGDAGGH